MTIENGIDEPKTAIELKYRATFVRGNFHALRALIWDQPGRTVVIGEAQLVHLEEHAVDYVTTSDRETLVKNRFSFEPYDGDEPIGYVFPTEAEAAKADAVAASLERGRRAAVVKARVDEEIARLDGADFTPTPIRTRIRSRQI